MTESFTSLLIVRAFSSKSDPRPGPVGARSNDSVENIRAIAMQDRRLTTVLLAELLGVGKGEARQIL